MIKKFSKIAIYFVPLQKIFLTVLLNTARNIFFARLAYHQFLRISKFEKFSKIAIPALLIIFIITPFFVPFVVQAQFESGDSGFGIVPACPEGSGNPGDPDYVRAGCGFPELMQLVRNIMNFLIAISIPLSAVAFAYAGFLYITARGNQSTLEKAHSIFTKVAIGFILVLTAWLIVWFITTTLLKDDFILLKP